MTSHWYERPVFYFSNPAALVGPGQAVTGPARSVRLDFELELAWVVGEDGAMRAWVNGRRYTDADLAESWWSVAEMTAYAAESTVVRAGDVFGSGTCGSGCILELSASTDEARYPWLRPGDVVELEIEGIGRLVHSVAWEGAGPAWSPDRLWPRPGPAR